MQKAGLSEVILTIWDGAGVKNYDLRDRYYAFPKDFAKEHDRVMKEYEAYHGQREGAGAESLLAYGNTEAEETDPQDWRD